MVYLLPVVVLFFMNLILSKSNFRYSKIIILFFSVTFIFISSLRYRIGTDWEPYYEFFHLPSYKLMLEHYFEPLYKLLAIIVKLLFNNYYAFLFVIGSFFLVETYTVNKIALETMKPRGYSSTILLLAIYMFRFADYMGGQRQALAVALCMVSLMFRLKNKTFASIIVWILAILFHYSASIFIIPMIIYGMIEERGRRIFEINPLVISLFLIVFFSISYWIINNSLVLNRNIPVISSILMKMVVYQGKRGTLGIIDYSFRDPLLVSERILFNLLFIIIGKNFYRKNRFGKFLLATYSFSTLYYIFFMFTARVIAGRGIAYFRFSDVLLLSTLPEALRSRLRKSDYNSLLATKLFEFLIITYIVARFVVVVLWANRIFYLPYKSILQ